MLVTAMEISAIVEGEIVGDQNVQVSAPGKIEEAESDQITFLANPKYEPFVYETKAGIVLVSSTFVPKKPLKTTLIKVEDVYGALGKLLNAFGSQQNGLPNGQSSYAQIHEQTKIDPSASVGAFTVIQKDVNIAAGVKIYDQVFIGEGVKIGAGSIIYPGARIFAFTEIGRGCIVHSNAVIGSEGFGFSQTEEGHYEKIAQIGKVVLEDEVEIGANTVIDRATMGATIIRKGAKLDNLIQIAHNVEIGEHTAIAAQAGIAGSTKIGSKALIGGQAGFAGHIKIADGAQVQAQSGVMSSIEKENEKLFGSPAIGYMNYLKSYAGFKNLPELIKRIQKLENEVKQLRSTKD